MKEKVTQSLEILYDFRQFVTFFVLLAVAVIFRIFSYIDGGQFVDLMKNVGIALMAVHGVAHLVSVGKDFVAAKYKQVASIASDSSSTSNDNS